VLISVFVPERDKAIEGRGKLNTVGLNNLIFSSNIISDRMKEDCMGDTYRTQGKS
jgi:hypothetical protein